MSDHTPLTFTGGIPSRPRAARSHNAPPPPPPPPGGWPHDPAPAVFELDSPPAGYFEASQARWATTGGAAIMGPWYDCSAVQVIGSFIVIHRPGDPSVILSSERVEQVEFE